MIYGGDFGYGLTMLMVAAIWAIGAWLVSEELEKKKPRKLKGNQELQAQKYAKAMRRYSFWRWSKPIAVVWLLGVAAALVNHKQIEKELQSNSGYLVPASDPTPPNPCGQAPLPKGALLVILGERAAWTMQFPATVLSIDKEDILVLDRDDKRARGYYY